MIALVITLTVIVAILLVLIVLAQDPKTGGFQSGAAPTQLMGVKKTTDLLERLTWGFVIGVFILAIGSSFVIGGADEGSLNSVNIDRATQSTTVEKTPAQQPAQGQQGQPAGQPQQQVNEAPQPAAPAGDKQP